ncbi:receptor homology region, transmembrane domain- and RING domain-containing protein 1 isoform X2 [Physcomitrium patens]|uniref:RING-type E3 ubiquitin transferase n=1 Tax=Physcomitrium patens TaxID=3218 RepID=A0A7I4FBQ2_PHYPA
MPSVVAEAGFASRIMSYREIMISLAGLCLVLLTLLIGRVNSAVILLAGTNETWSFPDVESRFAPRVPTAGVGGVLYASNPLDACSPLLNVSTPGKGSAPAFLLVQRGVCNFEIKVRLAQEAGFAAVIVYNDQDDRELVTMSFISLLAVSSVLATFFFVRQHRLRHLSARYLLREPAGMSVKEVNALPSLIFKCVEDGKCTSETCVVCLEDYIPGERLRLLPCQHEFHLDCIDQWLTLRKPFCPVCKRDAQSQVHEPVATETTPLMAAVGRALGGGSIRVGTSILSARSSPLFTTSVINSPNDTPDTRIFSLSYPDGGEDLC